jgi:hypothetical protein
MSARIIALRRGKTGDNQSFSKARARDPAIIVLVQSVLRPETADSMRAHVLSDPANVHQFACAFGDAFGFFSRPTLDTNSDRVVVAVGNFTDTIGEPFPVSIPILDFEGHFTTLIRRRDAETYGFATHPLSPDTVRGRAAGNRSSAAASMERLNFPLPDEADDGDLPVIAALPIFLPVAPGETFPHMLAADDAQSFAEIFPLFDVWRRGVTYVKTHNQGLSLTVGGNLFDPDSLAYDAANVDLPLNWVQIRAGIPLTLKQLSPTDTLYRKTRERCIAWSETIWVEVGQVMDAEPAPALGGGLGNFFTPEHFRAAMEPLVPKEKVFSSAARSTSRYRLLLAASPLPVGGGAPDHVVLPDLRDEFKAYLSIPGSATAGEELRELTRSRLAVANSLTTSLDRDVTLEAENITLAFSERIRVFGFLTEKLVNTTHTGAKSQLGLLQLLTPDRAALAVVLEGELEAAHLLMSNSTSGAAQLDASKASKLYCLGRLSTFRDSYEAVCNFRCLISVMVEDIAAPLVLVKLLEYCTLLVERTGRTFFEAYKGTPHLAVHPWQDLQTILSAFCRVSTDSTLYAAVGRGEPIAFINYRSAIDVSDALISELRAILSGNGLGKFAGIPICHPWFSPAPNSRIGNTTSGPVTGGDPKRQKTQASPPAKGTSPADLEHRKTLGMLQFDATAAGSPKLPLINILHRLRGARTQERLCMKFLTRGFACNVPDCKQPHITNISALSPDARIKLIEFVKKQPGLSWAEGKAPAGTS